MDEGGDLDTQARYILEKLSELVENINKDISRGWEKEYQCSDLADEVRRLKEQLRDSIPLGDRQKPPQTPATALEVNLQRRIHHLETQLKAVVQRLGKEVSRNWELEYRCKDLDGNIWRLEMRLRDSIWPSDAEGFPQNPMTTLEGDRGRDIKEPGGRVRYTNGRARSKSM